MREPSAIVIGAGIVGLATARALALNGFQVDVFERSGKAGGASIRNFGMIWPVGQPQGELYDRAIRTRNIWKALAPEAGIWSDPVGSLHTAYHPAEWIVLQEAYEIFTREGRAVEWLDADAVQQKSPIALAKGCKGGLFSREELLVDPREALAKLPAYLQVKWNIRFHWGQAVTEVHKQTIRAGGRKFSADLVFICSGSDFESLYPEQFSRYPVTKCKLQMMRFLPENANERVGPAVCGGLSLIHYAGFRAAPSWELLRQWFLQTRPEYIRHGIHVMISQNGLGELTIGDSHEYGLCPDPFDKQEINELILEYLKTFISLKNARQTESWNGVYAKHTQGQTDLFESPEEGVFILTATGGAGMTFAFGLAEERLASVLS
jgi:FAD dependent oxidoreductase TIGR03364